MNASVLHVTKGMLVGNGFGAKQTENPDGLNLSSFLPQCLCVLVDVFPSRGLVASKFVGVIVRRKS